MAEDIILLCFVGLLLGRAWDFSSRWVQTSAVRGKRERPLAVQLANEREALCKDQEQKRKREAVIDLDRKIRECWQKGTTLIDAKTSGQVDYSAYDASAFLRTKKPAPDLKAWIAAFPPAKVPGVPMGSIPSGTDDVLIEELPICY